MSRAEQIALILRVLRAVNMQRKQRSERQAAQRMYYRRVQAPRGFAASPVQQVGEEQCLGSLFEHQAALKQRIFGVVECQVASKQRQEALKAPSGCKARPSGTEGAQRGSERAQRGSITAVFSVILTPGRRKPRSGSEATPVR